MKKILITTGGTGGHVIPAKIIEEHLKNEFEIYYSTDLRGLKYLSSDIKKTIIIDTPKFNFNLYLPFKLVKLIYLTFQTILFLKKKKIEKIISTGGYMSIPIIIGARIRIINGLNNPPVKYNNATNCEISKIKKIKVFLYVKVGLLF